MSIKVIGIQDLNRRLKEVSKFMTKTEKRKVTFGAAKPLVSAGRRITPKREHPDKHRHPWQNPRYYKKKIQAYYIPGNLQKSFARVAQKRLKRTTDTFVGANFARIKQLIYGTTVPKRFYDAMTSDDAVDGFLARWLIFKSDDIDPPMQQRGNFKNIPTTLMQNVAYIQDMPIYEQNNTNVIQMPSPSPRVIQYSDGAKDILREFSEACNDNRLQEIKKGGLLAPIWGRSREHAIKLALVAHPYRESVIDSVTMQWACELAMYLSHVAIKTIENNVADSEHEKTLNKVTSIIKNYNDKNKGEHMPHSKLCNYVRFIKGRERNEILQQLVESGIIDVRTEKSQNGQAANFYKAL